MAILYPLALPLTRFQRSSFYLDRYENVQESLLSRRYQVVSIGAGTLDRWRGVFQTPPLTRADARRWNAFFDALRGVEGRFLVRDPGWDGPPAISAARVSSAGAPRVDAVPDARSVRLRNLVPGAQVLQPGDYLQIGGELKRVVQPVQSSASGEAVVDFEPALRVVPPLGTLVNITSPEAEVRLEEPHGPVEIGIRAEPVAFSWVEVL